MPQSVRLRPTRLDWLPALERDYRAYVIEQWRPHRAAMRYLQRYEAEAWERIQTCGQLFRYRRSVYHSDRYKLLPLSCRALPYCIVCAKQARARRCAAALRAFKRCTPKNRVVRLRHWVQTAPLTAEGEGWGSQARENVDAFFEIVREAWRELYGDGYGAFLSYHDFGERWPLKSHPHIDFTTNEYIIEDGKARLAPEFDFQAGERSKVEAAVVAAAQKHFPDVRRGMFRAMHRIETAQAYVKTLSYQVRELVDFRKMVAYDAEARTVEFIDYRTEARVRAPVVDFQAALAEYEARLNPWQRGGTRLHRYGGHMAPSKIRATQRSLGVPEEPHRDNCSCGECEEWEIVFLDEIDREVGPPRSLFDAAA